MKLLYMGYYVDPIYYQNILNTGYTDLSHARQNFEHRLLNEFSKKLNPDEWDLLTYIPYISDEHPEQSNINGKTFKVMKISKKNPFSSLKAFFAFYKHLIKSNIKDCSVLIYRAHPILSIPLFLLRKKLNLNLTTICSEVPQFQLIAYKDSISFLQKIATNLRIIENRKFDKYILLSKAMADVIPTNEKKYIIVEGICPDEFSEPTPSENIVMYAGGLDKFNNLDLLIDVCNKSEKVSELWLFGSGPELENIKAQTNNKIKYMGNIPSEQVFEYEKKAKLLVNLRDPELELTKYAFPSKTLEYMSSGSAVLTTKLEGIPNEYFNYINTVENLTEIEVKNAIESILDMDDTTYVTHCKKAQDFMKQNKTANKQADKILDFVLNK